MKLFQVLLLWAQVCLHHLGVKHKAQIDSNSNSSEARQEWRLQFYAQFVAPVTSKDSHAISIWLCPVTCSSTTRSIVLLKAADVLKYLCSYKNFQPCPTTLSSSHHPDLTCLLDLCNQRGIKELLARRAERSFQACYGSGRPRTSFDWNLGWLDSNGQNDANWILPTIDNQKNSFCFTAEMSTPQCRKPVLELTANFGLAARSIC